MMRWPRSIAIRLTIWYAATAFFLVATVAWAQYRQLVRELSNEDDQLLSETMEAAQLTDPVIFSRAHDPGATGPRVRVLDGDCGVVAGEFAGGPPPDCLRIGDELRLRTWQAPDGRLWRIASQRVPPQQPNGPSRGRIEVLLDRSIDNTVLAGHRRMLAGVLPATLLLSAVLGYSLARRGLRPLDALAMQVANIDTRSLDRPLQVTDAPEEMRAIVNSFEGVQARLNAAFASLTQFSNELAHELRTPMHVVRQQIEVALTRSRTAEEYHDVLVSSLEEMDRMRQMVDDILFLARAEDPRSRISRTELVVADELADVADYLEPLAQEREITLAAKAAPELRLAADRMMLRRALVNVVTNAIRHTPRRGAVTLDASTRDGLIAIQIRDTGAGIPPTALAHVFDRYYRVPGTGAGSADSTGLGLAIVRGIASLHGGFATVSSTLGEGTLVTLVFPAREGATA